MIVEGLVLKSFTSGALMIGYWTAGVFFLRFWKKTGDRLLRNFGWALWVLMAERVFLLFVSQMNEMRPFIYSFRLVAFALILVAIVEKNRQK